MGNSARCLGFRFLIREEFDALNVFGMIDFPALIKAVGRLNRGVECWSACQSGLVMLTFLVVTKGHSRDLHMLS